MSKKIKMARSTEQEYAHDYKPKTREEQYQYPNEEQRVKYRVDSDSENNKSQKDLYNITPKEVEAPPANRIRARLNNMEILEDHRQKSYKVSNIV